MSSQIATVARRLALAALVVAPLSSVACAAPTSAEDVDTSEDAIESSRATDTWRYAGSLRVNAAAYTVEVSITAPRAWVASQTLESGKSLTRDWFHYCRAYTESPKAVVRTRVLDANGTVVADSSRTDWVSVFTALDRTTACPNGHLVTPKAATSLVAEMFSDGLEPLALQGVKVSIPFGYGTRGSFSFRTAASYRPITALTATNEATQHENRSKAFVERGVLSLSAPEDFTINVGLPASGEPFSFAVVAMKRQ